MLSINTSVHNACLTRDLSSAQQLLIQQIISDQNTHNAYANRAFISAQKCDWDDALHDALQVRDTAYN